MQELVRSSLARAAAALTLTTGLLAAAPAARADQLWNWSYSASGVAASGTLTTSDLANSAGYYTVLGISGQRNGVSITGLFPTGTAIPGNEPYAVDNLLAAGSSAQLSEHGLGYTLADGSASNPYWATWSNPNQYYEVYAPTGGLPLAESPVSFTATLAVPEPGSIAMMALGLGLVAGLRRRSTRR